MIVLCFGFDETCRFIFDQYRGSLHSLVQPVFHLFNFQWDYAYYVVSDYPEAHTGGFKSGLTGQLDRDVQCMTIDFDTDMNREFIWSIGYSADKDPELRHCAMENTKINGVPWYTNLWLEDCAMTGGASGGGWIKDMDEEGVGTVGGVNSWGFSWCDQKKASAVKFRWQITEMFG